MSLWDPEAAGNAALWLRLPAEQMMEIQTGEYPGRTAVWVPFAETGYTKGIITGDGEKAGTKKVMRSDGKEKEYKVSFIRSFRCLGQIIQVALTYSKHFI